MSVAPIGKMRLRLSIEAPVDTDDGMGGVTRTFAAVGAAWGAIAPVSDAEVVDADRIAQRISHRIAIRYRAGLTAAMQLRAGTRLFRIHAITDPDGDRRRLVCHTEELTP